MFHLDDERAPKLYPIFTVNFEDSLIDWTSPIVEQNLSRPLIPLPASTSPQSDIFGDNPFDALERQINDGVLDFLNASSPLSGCDHNSPSNRTGQGEDVPEQSAILIRLDNDGDLHETDTKVHLLNIEDFREAECIRSSARSDQTPDNASILFHTPLHSILWVKICLHVFIMLDQ